MIREMTDTDIDQAVNIWKDAMPVAHKDIPQEYWDTLISNLIDELKNADERYVYEEDESIVGFIVMRTKDNYIYEFCVHRSMQGIGIGTKLLDKLKTAHQYLTLHVYEQNENVDFYTNPKRAFRVINEPSKPTRKYPKLFMKWSK